MTISSDSVPAAPTALPTDDPWVLAYDGFHPEQEGLREALCAAGNGHFVTRGAGEEATDDHFRYPGTYVAGGYNRLTSEVAGRTVVNEDLVNFPNWLPLRFRIDDGEWLDPAALEVLAYRQELRLREGVLFRSFRLRDAAGRQTRIESRRLVSMACPHLAAIESSVTAENWEGTLWIRAGIDGSVRNNGVARYRQLANRHLDVVEHGRVSPEGIYLVARTTQSRFEVAVAARTRVERAGERIEDDRRILDSAGDRIAEEIRVAVGRNEAIRIEKIVAVFSSHDRGVGERGMEARQMVRTAADFAAVQAAHHRAWRALWHRYDVEIGDEGTRDTLAREQLTLRLYVFHLLQTVSPHTVGLDVGAPARGLHGEAYRGHVFWDETFVLPFFEMRQPAITRSLLLYRYYRLDAARQLAAEAGLAGAMFPWQSSHDGREATQQAHLNPLSGQWGPDWSYLQRHVGAAVAYNVWRYWHSTGDREFLRDYGAEMILEIARFWASLTTWNEERGRYEITGVMGPDEYHEKYPDAAEGGLSNNAYTNVMAAWCLRRALDVLDEVGESRREELISGLQIGDDERRRWRQVAERMFVPFLDNGIPEQFEGYAELQPLDWESYRRKYGDIARMDRILKAEGDTPDRYQLSKQADATMLFYLFEPDQLQEVLGPMGYALGQAAIERTIDYYRERTSHGSTLSEVVFASVVHHLDCEEGCRLFLDALRSDIDDVQGGTTREGIHLGAMAGTVAIVLRRYAGVELSHDGVHLEPAMPSRLKRIRCRVHWRGRWLGLDMTTVRLRVTADRDGDEPIPVCIAGQWHALQPGGTLEHGA